MIVNYKYINVFWQVEANEEIVRNMQCLFSDYFEEIESDISLNFKVKLRLCNNRILTEELLRFGKEVIIHNSRKVKVHEIGKFIEDGLVLEIMNLSTGGVYVYNRLSDEIIVFNEDPLSLVNDGVRIVRDFVKRYTEIDGGVLYHAAAIQAPNTLDGILLIGSKGSGKSTISLKLAMEHNYYEVSRDRCFLFEQGEKRIKIYGWPNYYNVSVQTMVNFPNLLELIPKRFEMFKKHYSLIKEKIQLLSSDIPIKRIKATYLNKVFFLSKNKEDELKKEDILASNCYTPNDLNYTNWHDIACEIPQLNKNALKLTRNILSFRDAQVIRWSKLDEAIYQITGEIK
jgi:hypothetical protein